MNGTILSISSPWSIDKDSATGERLPKPIQGSTLYWTDSNKNPNGLGLQIIKSTIPASWFPRLLQIADLSKGLSVATAFGFTFTPQGKIKILSFPELGIDK